MIYVDVYVAPLQKSYEIRCDENARVEALKREIGQLLAEEENWQEGLFTEKLWLCCVEQERALEANRTLRESGVVNGNRLLLV